MTISVVTPTFNRVLLLTRCYESLVAQSCQDFEWVVVDDGSTDETAASVRRWSTEAPFVVRLVQQQNRGKHVALNHAFATDLREYVLLLDSDDALAPEAVASLTKSLVHSDSRAVGLIGNRHALDTGTVIGRPMPDGLELTTGRELRERFGITGDTMRVYRSDVLRAHPFPVCDGERFMPENVVFDAIDHDHLVAVTHDVVYLCDYQETGLSANVMEQRAANPRGFAASLESSAWISERPLVAIKYTLKYQVWSKVFLGTFDAQGFRRRGIFRTCLPVAAALWKLRLPRFIFETRNWASPATTSPSQSALRRGDGDTARKSSG